MALWIPKVDNTDIVWASHVNDLQTIKVDGDGTASPEFIAVKFDVGTPPVTKYIMGVVTDIDYEALTISAAPVLGTNNAFVLDAILGNVLIGHGVMGELINTLDGYLPENVTLIGYRAGYHIDLDATDGYGYIDNNVAIGYEAGSYQARSSNNVDIGYQAGAGLNWSHTDNIPHYELTYGHDSIRIGYRTGRNAVVYEHPSECYRSVIIGAETLSGGANYSSRDIIIGDNSAISYGSVIDTRHSENDDYFPHNNILIGSAIQGMMWGYDNIIIGSVPPPSSYPILNSITLGAAAIAGLRSHSGYNMTHTRYAGTGGLEIGQIYHYTMSAVYDDGTESGLTYYWSNTYNSGPNPLCTAGNTYMELYVPRCGLDSYGIDGHKTVVARKIWRTLSDSFMTSEDYFVGHALFLVTTINDDTTTSYIDSTPDQTLYNAWDTYEPLYSMTSIGGSPWFSHQWCFGQSSSNGLNHITELAFNSVASATPYDIILKACNGYGLNISGADFTIEAGAATGNGAGGQILFKTAVVGSSGKHVQSYATALTIKEGVAGIAVANHLDVGGDLRLASTKVVKINSIQVVGAQALTQAALKADYTTGNLDSEAEIIAAINATNAGFNTLLAKVKTHGLLASA